jgi:hypothetical protein
MTRAATGDTVVVKPAPNIYTVLVIAATVAVAVALAIVIFTARNLDMKLF